MMAILTYDLSSHREEVRAAALRAGFQNFIVVGSGERIPLPETTLAINSRTTHEAMADFTHIVWEVSSSIAILRAVAFDWDTGSVYTDLRNIDPETALFMPSTLFAPFPLRSARA
jgi:hypothetical protein